MSNTENNLNKNIDILQELDIKEEIKILQSQSNINTNIWLSQEDEKYNEIKILNIKEEVKRLENESINKKTNFNTEDNNNFNNRKTNRIEKRKKIYFLSSIIFFTKYLITSSLIFWVLLLTTNYSAYINIAKSYIYSWEMKITEQRLVNSVEATNIKDKYKDIAKVKVENKIIDKTISEEKETKLSIKKLKKKQDKKDINLNIKITPYSNRVIIPKIWKNIPLLDIKNRNISGESELNDIFAKELEKWIIRYPGSSKPWENWTSFIFWHSSNFPWIKWEYNDVFATLDNVSYWDEIIVYYWQEKFKYKIREKKVITPWDVSVLERNKKKSEITLMTCWPIWTTLNRLIVIWELIEE